MNIFRRWRERDHPRDPLNGQFIEADGTSISDWVQQMSQQMKQRSGVVDRSKPSRPIRQSVASARSARELARATQSELYALTGRETKIDLRGMDLEVAKHHMEGVLRGAEAFPWAHLPEIRTFSADPRHFAETYFEAGDPSATYMSFNKESTFDNFQAQTVQMFARSYSSSGRPDLTHYGSHEFGHVAAATVDHDEYVRILKRAYGKYIRGARDRIMDELGVYATRDIEELIGESAAHVISGGGSSIAKHVIEILRGMPVLR